MQPTDIVILSNGPGEVVTWVRPVVKKLRLILSEAEVRISVVLSPCPHSTGKEIEIAQSYPEVDRVLPASDFFAFLLWGKTKDEWQWHHHGIVIFLGGDQFYTVAISKRLGYFSLIYAEWDARWYRFVDNFAVMNKKVIERVPQAYRHKFTLVGDLMADVALEVQNESSTLTKDTDQNLQMVGLLVGSKPSKLSQGVPLCMAIADKVSQLMPQVQFVIPLAPTLDLATLDKYTNQQHNPLITLFGNVTGKVISENNDSLSNHYLVTSGETKIKLVTNFPAYDTLVDCQMCLTTVGANTAELASLGVPMLVLLPTQQLDAMRSWDGLPGILANLPGIGSILAKLINWLILRQGKLFAWPNIWAGKEIVPELVGKLQPEMIAELLIEYLTHPEKLQQMQNNLRSVRGKTGASQQIADIIKDEVIRIQ